MELNYDWRSFKKLFHPHHHAEVLQGNLGLGPIYAVIEGDLIVAVLSASEDLTDWLGGSYGEFKAQFQYREVIAFERKNVDHWTKESLTIPHFYGQSEHLRRSAKTSVGASDPSALGFNQHFLIQEILGGWAKVLPSSYGVYIRVEGQVEQSFLLLVRRGSIEGFLVPDLTSIGVERRRNPADVVKYLAEKYLVPIQGLFVPSLDWSEWARSDRPWKQVAQAVRENRVKLVPFRWNIAALIGARAYLQL
jgi:hypothetical protein